MQISADAACKGLDRDRGIFHKRCFASTQCLAPNWVGSSPLVLCLYGCHFSCCVGIAFSCYAKRLSQTIRRKGGVVNEGAVGFLWPVVSVDETAQDFRHGWQTRQRLDLRAGI